VGQLGGNIAWNRKDCPDKKKSWDRLRNASGISWKKKFGGEAVPGYCTTRELAPRGGFLLSRPIKRVGRRKKKKKKKKGEGGGQPRFVQKQKMKRGVVEVSSRGDWGGKRAGHVRTTMGLNQNDR